MKGATGLPGSELKVQRPTESFATFQIPPWLHASIKG